MYILTWNEEHNTVYAGLGGVVTHAEGCVLTDEITELLDKIGAHSPTVELDAFRATRFAAGAFEELEKLRGLCAGRGAILSLITDERETAMSADVRAILEGHVHSSEFRVAS
ncbi:MAG: hypothetical protein JNK63_11050 [Chthonomonas sp.]|nr:hypothetical protein [Chthonomonas sp.]